MNAKGGTEILLTNLLLRIEKKVWHDINLITNNTNIESVVPGKINVLWIHHHIDQPSVQGLKDRKFIESIDYFVFVSHWQYEKYSYSGFQIPDSKVWIIKNAIEEFKPNAKSKDKFQLIYTSTPWRGLDILIDAFELINQDNVFLTIYSSTSIYGNEFHLNNNHIFVPLFEKAASIKNVAFKGFGENSVIRDEVSKSHIFAFPSIWQETSCLAAIEAAMGGANIVTTNFGALTETLAGFGDFVQINRQDRKVLVSQFAKRLITVMDNYWSVDNQRMLEMQHEYFKRFYSWDARIKEWKLFFELILKNRVR